MAEPAARGGPLEGITVVTIEQAVSAPMCTKTLADFGARVIKVENPRGGDFARHYDDVVGGLAAHFVWANRGKESVTLDLKTDDGIEMLHRLLGNADVLVSTSRRGPLPASVSRPQIWQRVTRNSSRSRSTAMGRAGRCRTSGRTTFSCRRSRAHVR